MTRELRAGADTVIRHALLGLQFRDAVDGRVVADGLDVQINDLWQPHRRQALVANRSGVFALHRFAGLHGDGNDVADSPNAGRFRVTARDLWSRYVPTAVSPTLPGEGLFALAGMGSPAALPPHVPLFSAATRALPVAMASLRAELRLAGRDDTPVPWARLELWLGSQRLAEGVADERGRALLAFPLPRPPEPALRTSPASLRTVWQWSVVLRGFWHPDRRAGEIPDLEDVYAQPEVLLLQAAGASAPLPPLTLYAGDTLVAASAPSSFLYVAE